MGEGEAMVHDEDCYFLNIYTPSVSGRGPYWCGFTAEPSSPAVARRLPTMDVCWPRKAT